MRSALIPVALSLLLTSVAAAPQDSIPAFEHAFPGRLIFSETPEIGHKWKPGLRLWISGFKIEDDTSSFFLPIPLLSINWNAGNILSLDLFWAGYPTITGDDSSTIADNFGFFTVKSRPLDFDVGPGSLKAGGGLKLYWANFALLDSLREGLEQNDGAFSPFITASYFLRGHHYFNLSASAAIRSLLLSDSTRRVTVTWNIIPGYRFFIGRQRHWSLGVEYYLMNPAQLPMKVGQYYTRPDHLDFYNPDQLMISYIMWGVSYSRRSFRIDTYFANYINFSPPFFPFVGFGWDF